MHVYRSKKVLDATEWEGFLTDLRELISDCYSIWEEVIDAMVFDLLTRKVTIIVSGDGIPEGQWEDDYNTKWDQIV